MKRANTFCLFLLLALAVPTGAAPEPATTALRGEGWSALFRDGVLVGLRNRLTDEMFVTGEGVAPLTGVRRARESLLATAGPGPAPTLSGGGASVTAAWPDGTRLSQTAAVEGGELAIRQSASTPEPPLVGVQWGLATVPEDLEVLVPGLSGLRFGKDAPDGTWRFEYPQGWEAQFVLLQGKAGGFLIMADDPASRYKQLTLTRRGGRNTLAFETRAVAPFAGVKEVRSVKWRVRPYRGSWLEGARLYREWAEKAFDLATARATRPQWADRIRCVFIVGMETELLEELAKRVKPEQTLLYVPDWRRDGYDRNYPDYTASDQFGPWLQRAKALGFRVMPHVNYFGCDPLHPLYERFKGQQMRDPFSQETLWWNWDRATPPIKFAYINPASRAWRELFVSRMKEFCEKYPVDALHLDQTLCIYNDHNGLIDGMTCAEGNLALHRELRAALPQVALSGEGLNEVSFRYEEFTQRHLHGLRHSESTWSDRLIAMAHPISSSLLTPHTAIYGYLGMVGIETSGLYWAWRRGYDRFGVIPTLARPSLSLLRERPDTVASFFAEASFFQRTGAVPDFTAPWPKDALFAYRLANGGRAYLLRDQGVTLVEERPGGARQVISRRIEGVSQVELPGSIPGWRAYDEKRIFGLDPARSYAYLDRPRDLNAFRVASLPEGALLRRVGVRENMAVVALEDSASEVARLWQYTGRVQGGVRLNDGAERRYPGAVFNDASGAYVQTEGDGIAIHPPWKGTVREEKTGVLQADGIGVVFLEYSLRLPDRERVRFEAGVGLRRGAVGKSDGVTVRVEARAGEMKREAQVHHAGADAAPLLLDLSEFRGKEIVLRLEAHPGPAGQATFDWGAIHRPHVVAEDPTPRAVVLHSPKAPAFALCPEGPAALSPLGANRYALKMRLPGTALIGYTTPQPVTLPLDLRTAPFAAALVDYDGSEQAPHSYSMPRPYEATVGGVKKPGLNAHPPNNGQLVLDYALRLPDAPARLEAFAGIRDGSRSKGVGFLVQVNGREVWSARLNAGDPWKPVQVDLAPYAGQVVVLSLITDALTDYQFDWATWGEPRLVAGR